MMRKVFSVVAKLAILYCVLFVIYCGNNSQNTSLSVTVIPQNPFLIPTGGATTLNGISVTPPYFIINEVILNYSGTGGVMIFDIQITQTGGGTTGSSGGLGGSTGSGGSTTPTYTCDINGDILKAAFPSLPTIDGQIVLQKSNNAVASSQIACSGLTLPNPVPTTFNYPMTVTVFGAVLSNPNDPTSVGGRVQATQSIIVE